MTLAIVGSTFLDGDERAFAIIDEVLEKFKPDRVVSGGAKGIDSMAAAAAKKRGIAVTEYKPTVNNWGASGGFKERNQQIANECDALVRIIGSSATTYGSGWTRDQAAKQGKITSEYVIDTGPQEARK